MSASLAKPFDDNSGWARFRRVARRAFSLSGEETGPLWMVLAVTVLFSTAVAVVLSVLFVATNPRNAWWPVLWQTWVISQCIGLAVQWLVMQSLRWARPRGLAGWPRFTRGLGLCLVILLGVLVGYTVGFGLTGRNFVALVAQYPRFGVGQLLIAGLAMLAWFLISSAQSAQLRRDAERARDEAQAQALERQAADAELRALQAQIEPHFLFNTLANAIALVDHDPPQAKWLLEQLNDYLRATLNASRRTGATLGDELHLVERYLTLMQLRMGTRLRFAIEVPDDLRSLPFAPLLLQPLVENALEHGLEPKLEGGTITLRAERRSGELLVQVQDTGLGSAARGSDHADRGLGLSNVRQRVLALWGPAAQVDLSLDDAGATASLVVPLQR